jgi:precorrin-2 dehydrogenase / sirohydrochlorin ferrochelatase
MLPLTLDLATWSILLVGAGPALERRIALVRDGGGQDIQVLSPHAASAAIIATARLLFIAGIAWEDAAPLAGIARAHRVLVNVEDIPDLCDFHVPALIRRGDLSIAISTSGTNPGLAAALRRELDARFDASWESRVQSASLLRVRMRADGLPTHDVVRAMERCAASWLGTGPFPS